MRLARVTVVAAALMAIAAASIFPDPLPQVGKPDDNACITWVSSTSGTKTDVSNLVVASTDSYVLFNVNGACKKTGDVVPCFVTNTSTFGHHDYVKGYLPYDYCRTSSNGDYYGANNFYLPQLGAQSSSLKWVSSKTGSTVPANAVRFGNTVLARASNNAAGNCAGLGYTGWASGPADASLGKLHFTIEKSTYSVSDFDVLVCDSQTSAPPTPPPTLPPNNKPYIRFGNTIPYNYNVDVVISQPNATYTWSNYAFSQFSDWVEIFSNGFGEISVYENNFGKRGALQLKREIPLTPGPLVVVTRGGWPPVNYNSVETIAASYIPVAVGSGVRLFNLSPDTALASLTDTSTGTLLAKNIAYSIGSDWAPISTAAASFSVSDATSGSTLASVSFTPPNAPFVFTIFFLGLQNMTGTNFAPTGVALIDAPESL